MIDKHTLSKNILAKYLNEQPDMNVIDKVNTGYLGIQRCSEAKGDIDLAIIDIKLPDLSGMMVAKTILEENPDVKAVFLTSAINERLLAEAVKIGVNGYFSREVEPDLLIILLREVMKGFFCTSPDISHLLVNFLKTTGELPRSAADDMSEYHFFSRRELDVLNLLRQGLSNKGISDKLFISENTVKNHLQNIYEKLGVSNRTQAVATIIDLFSSKWE
ncbi:MAG: Transcriptional regulatory protein DegU [Pelotomaculum sp. PtaU1.Bin065]|nr:MAG: Transcriptional regulatory protein DegU [Pelotomaculum sp. PtaU1.Bin065]